MVYSCYAAHAMSPLSRPYRPVDLLIAHSIQMEVLLAPSFACDNVWYYENYQNPRTNILFAIATRRLRIYGRDGIELVHYPTSWQARQEK